MKTKYIFLCAAFLTALAGCSLDYDPISTPSELTEGKLTDTTKAVLADRDAAVSQRKAIYELLRNRQEHMHLDYVLLGDCHADNAYVGTVGAEVVPYETNTIDASNPDMARDWSRYLEDIAKANVLINGVSENIDSVYPSYFPPRASTEECYKQIISDLTDAEQYAPDFDNADRTLLSKTVAQALLCKVYAEKAVQDYDKVISYAEKVRATPGLQLEPDFATLWGWDDTKKDCVKRNTSEGILEVHWYSGAGNWESWMFGRCLENYDQSFSWAKWATPSRDLINAFDKEGDAVRRDQTIVYYACGWSNYYPADHYPFMYKLRSGYNNEYILRLADIILLEAEAYAYKGDLQNSAKLVNMVRRMPWSMPCSMSVAWSWRSKDSAGSTSCATGRWRA